MLENFFKKAGIITAAVTAAAVTVMQLLPSLSPTVSGIICFSTKAVINTADYTLPKNNSSAVKNTNNFTEETDSGLSDDTSSISENETISSDGIITKQIDATTANTSYEGIYINNKTSVPLDIGALLKLEGTAKIKSGVSEPQILIMHTHTTESYADCQSTRSDDLSSGVVRVGREMCDILNAAGINTVHDETVHDSPAYNGSYSRAAETINRNLSKYPSIAFVIDLHRDSIGSTNSGRVKPTVEINGVSAAQVMFVAGCETGEITDFPDWKYNLSTALSLQKEIESEYKGLTRAIHFTDCRYNMNLTRGSMLIEIGTEVNTLDEAVYSGSLVAKSLAKMLLEG